MQDFFNLDEYNKKLLYDRLKTCLIIENTYRCNDVIEILSTAKMRDKRIINNYSDDEIILRYVKSMGYTRLMRFFTEKGLARYIEEGKIISYKNVCQYFSVEEKDLENKKLHTQLEKLRRGDLFITSRILKWLFEKRKSCKALPKMISSKDLMEWIESKKLDVQKEKLDMIKTL